MILGEHMKDYMDHHSWLVNANLLTEEMKDNIHMAGLCIVEDTLDVGTFIDFNSKEVKYRLLLPSKLYDNIKLLEEFEKGNDIGFFNYFKLKKFIKAKRKTDETGMGYKLQAIGEKFVKGYLNKEWSASVEIYKEDDNEKKDFCLYDENDKSFN